HKSTGHLTLTHSVTLSCVCITAKPGKCPPRSSGNRSCTSSCKSDSNCPNNEKCCSNGCGRYCTAPYTGICVILFWSVVDDGGKN
uniref:WAP domain-containing protein n=1 Tax=Sinocyclocheilus rhinocerous TaxID=307959 RepID=A0A673LGB5_9TELE